LAITIAGSLDWPFTMLKYKYIFPVKYAEAILANRSRQRLGFEISKMQFKNRFIVLFITIFGTLSFGVGC